MSPDKARQFICIALDEYCHQLQADADDMDKVAIKGHPRDLRDRASEAEHLRDSIMANKIRIVPGPARASYHG